MWARREILPEHYNAQGPILPWHSPFAAGGGFNPEDAPVPTVYVDANARRDVEAFSAQMEELGTPANAPPEAMEYARMDASAMLSRLAGGDKQLFEDLQAAVMAKNMQALLNVLEDKKVGTRSLRQELGAAIQSGDKKAAAEALRRMDQPALNAMRARTAGRPMYGKEIGGPQDIVMGTERRATSDVWLTGKPVYPASFEMSRPYNQESEPTVYGTIALGYDAAAWEQDCLFHAYVYDAGNAIMDLAIEAAGTGVLDGRLNGTRGFGPKY